MDAKQRQEVTEGIIHILKGNGDPLAGFGTVIVSANTAEEAAQAFNAGADAVHIQGQTVFRNQVLKQK